MRRVIVILCAAMLPSIVFAADTTQVVPPKDTAQVAAPKGTLQSEAGKDTVQTVVKKDTVLYIPLNDRDSSLVISPLNLEKRLYQNPTAALFKSLFVPGLGQLGNRSYFKAVLFAGLEWWFIGSSLHYGSQASGFRRQYDASTDIPTRQYYYYLYRDRADKRNEFRWFAGITAFVSMFDAYVDAHLSGSPTAERNRKVELSVGPTDAGGGAIRLALNF